MLQRLIYAWVGCIQRWAPWVIFALLLLAGSALKYTLNNLSVFTDTAALLSEELPFRQSYEVYRQAFPNHVDMFVVVVDAPNPGASDTAVQRLAQALTQQPDLFIDVYQPPTDPSPDPSLIEDSPRILYVKPKLDFTEPLAAEKPITAVRSTSEALGLTKSNGFRVRITGDAALGYEELTVAMEGAQLAGLIALIMVAAVLFIGLRSIGSIIATLLNLLVGLVLTAGFATVFVGHLNLISIAFAVLYIGLGVDYGIHICLRYREFLETETQDTAVRKAVVSLSGALGLCTLTTAAGFFAFLPTAFTGVAELGLIAGGGMFINLFLSWTLLPALLTCFAPPRPKPILGRSPRDKNSAPTILYAASNWIQQRTGLIRISALAIGVAAIAALPGLSFDRNPMNLRPGDSESVATLRALVADSATPPYHITALATDQASALTLSAQLQALHSVGQVLSIADFVPHDLDQNPIADLPESIRRRWINDQGIYRLAVYPADDIEDNQNLRRFVTEVQSVAPAATDEPVLSLLAGDAIVEAFVQAFTLAFVVISIFLLLALRDIKASIIALSPLILAGLITTGCMVLFGIQFNFANVIALPLLLGIGVDNSIHMVQRSKNMNTGELLRSSTARGVLFSSLTTLCGFGNLMFSSHPGTASMGAVLSIGVVASIICTLVFLPSLFKTGIST